MLRRSILAVLVAGSAAWSAEAVKPTGPWSESFTMVLRDVERTFVVHRGSSWLLTRPEDFADPDFVLDKDLVVLAKFQRGQGERAWLYRFDGFDVRAAPELWSTRVDGDNAYVFCRIAKDPDGGAPIMRVAAMEPAPSDAQLIAARLQDVSPDNWEARLGVVAWAREQATREGNHDFWLQESDRLLTKVITDAVAQADGAADLALARRAIDWAVDLQKDPVRAARIASAPWIRAKGGKEADDIAKRMRRLGMDFYREQWRPRAEALALEFDDRFAATPWKDADGFYKLGRWADANAESLPLAKDRAYRAYQAGLKANPDHPGIKRELGLDLEAAVDVADTGKGPARLEYRDAVTGGSLRSPGGWKRESGTGEGIRWVDPTSDTAYMTARFFDAGEAKPEELWTTLSNGPRKLTGFAVKEEITPERANGFERRLHYAFTEDRAPRLGVLVFAVDSGTRIAAVLEASYVEEESGKALTAFDESHASLSLKPSKAKAAAPAGTGGAAGPGAAPGGAAPGGPAPAGAPAATPAGGG